MRSSKEDIEHIIFITQSITTVVNDTRKVGRVF